MKHAIPTGVFDIIPNDEKEQWRSSYLWSYVESVMRITAREFGFKEIRTPMFERAELFQRSVGDSSDIVSKEMYHFKDKGDRDMALRPEGTAPVMRAFVEHHMANLGQVHKLFYISPMFRYDRPQAGRYRQHHQFGIEAIGTRSPEQDVEVIDLLMTTLYRLGLQNLKVKINTIGDQETTKRYRDALKTFLKPHLDNLSGDSRKRFEANPLRILDSKDEKDKEVLKDAPSVLDFLTDESYDYFDRAKKLLNEIGIEFEVDPQLVRGLDYYNELVFEVLCEDLGSQNSLGGGGRYDGLLKEVGGPDLPAMGFGAGIERIIQALLSQNCTLPTEKGSKIYLVPLGEEAHSIAFKTLHDLRRAGISAQMCFGGKKLNKAMQQADQSGAEYAAVIGDEELASKEVELKEMATGEKQKVRLADLKNFLKPKKQESFSRSEVKTELSVTIPDQKEAESFIKNIQSSLENTKVTTEQFHQTLEELKKLIDE